MSTILVTYVAKEYNSLSEREKEFQLVNCQYEGLIPLVVTEHAIIYEKLTGVTDE